MNVPVAISSLLRFLLAFFPFLPSGSCSFLVRVCVFSLFVRAYGLFLFLGCVCGVYALHYILSGNRYSTSFLCLYLAYVSNPYVVCSCILLRRISVFFPVLGFHLPSCPFFPLSCFLFYLPSFCGLFFCLPSHIPHTTHAFHLIL